MILCPRTGRKPWTCRCPECLGARLDVGVDPSPTPNRQAGWAPPRCAILNDDHLVRIEAAGNGGALRSPSGALYTLVVGDRDVVDAARRLASVDIGEGSMLRATHDLQHFALSTDTATTQFSRATLDEAMRQRTTQVGMHSRPQSVEQAIRREPTRRPKSLLDRLVVLRGADPLDWAERHYPILRIFPPVLRAARALCFTAPYETAVVVRYNIDLDEYAVVYGTNVFRFDGDTMRRRTREIESARRADRAAGDPGDGDLRPTRREWRPQPRPQAAFFNRPLPITEDSTLRVVHELAQELAGETITFSGFRAELDLIAQQVMCWWEPRRGAVLPQEAVAARCLQKTGVPPDNGTSYTVDLNQGR